MAAAVISERHSASATHLWRYDAGRVLTSKLSSSVRAKDSVCEARKKKLHYLCSAFPPLSYCTFALALVVSVYVRLCYLPACKRWRVTSNRVAMPIEAWELWSHFVYHLSATDDLYRTSKRRYDRSLIHYFPYDVKKSRNPETVEQIT